MCLESINADRKCVIIYKMMVDFGIGRASVLILANKLLYDTIFEVTPITYDLCLVRFSLPLLVW
jgi:hypothetical protein